ncbi:glycosyltransferase [Flavobacteriaceae bacterium]|nr:glycosyltransferase [Flavobacteriaceae bacterium]
MKKEYSKIYPKKILVAQDGVNLLEFKNLREKKINSKKLKIVYTGSFFIWKGTDFLIKCAKIDHHNDYILVGGSQDEIKRLKKSFDLSKINNLKLLPKTNRIGLKKYIKMADILVLPNLNIEKNKWTSPIKLFEYMASKRLIMASDISAFDGVLNQNNCILYKPNSPDDFINKLRNINELNEGEKIKAAYREVRKFTWGNRAKLIKDYIFSDS